MTEDQEFAELTRDFPEWYIWRGRTAHGQPDGWHATFQGSGRSVIVASDGPAELRVRLVDAKQRGACRV